MQKPKIKALIIDDSAYLRAILREMIDSDERFEVVAVARDPYEARELIKKHNPDVLTLDIEMPRMNGITFLKNLMRLRPMPVVMVSTLTQVGAPATLEALELGAVDFISKPSSGEDAELMHYKDEILNKIFWASKANINAVGDEEKKKRPSSSTVAPRGELKAGYICTIGASTGGTEAIRKVVCGLPDVCPPILVSQHIPATFSLSFAKRVNGQTNLNVHEAQDGQEILPNNVYIAPGHSHLKMSKRGSRYFCVLDQGPLVNRHRPAVEVMYDSVNDCCGENALGVLLTGMGNDGAEALLRMKQAGCTTVAQDEETSVVWGMPGSAYKIGAVDHLLCLDKIANFIVKQAYT